MSGSKIQRDQASTKITTKAQRTQRLALSFDRMHKDDWVGPQLFCDRPGRCICRADNVLLCTPPCEFPDCFHPVFGGQREGRHPFRATVIPSALNRIQLDSLLSGVGGATSSCLQVARGGHGGPCPFIFRWA